MSSNNDGPRIYWKHDESATAAFVLAIAFGAGALLHLYQLWRYKAWSFTVFCIGAIMMMTGYLFRGISINNPKNFIFYLIQSLCIILPPSLYAATVYMIFGRIIVLVDAPHLSLIRPSWITKIFVLGDVFAFVVQVSGGGMMTMEGKEKMGSNVMIMGLIIQLVFFGFFVIVAGLFHYRVVNSNFISQPHVSKKYARFHWTTMMHTLYIVAGLIIFRCLFRVIEFQQGYEGPIRTNEKFMYAFDTTPMFLVQSIFHIVHSGRVLPQRVKEFADRKSRHLDSDVDGVFQQQVPGGQSDIRLV